MRVKASEMSNPNRSRSLWTCAHCALHLGNLEKREIVVEHVKSVHGINLPCEPEDLFLFERCHSRDAFEASYVVEPPHIVCVKTIHCLECAAGKPSEQKRLFDLSGVKSHLAAKHKVQSPVANIHYR